ncbi:MAG: hypothetical protein PWP48_59 [Clostridiales bacterium]|jgi:secondary thiamine-phosphate synthase enzyme|nr:hypothetical protein [Clostridiales bacterium]
MFMEKLDVVTTQRQQFIDITNEIQTLVDRSDITDGICMIYVPHTTAGVTINENADPDVMADVAEYLNKAVPRYGHYAHVEGNSDAHIKSSFFGCSQIVPIVNGKLKLGRWQAVYFCEFDGPRPRQVLVTVIHGR